MIRLFLNNIEVELNSSVQFAINKQFEDVTSPADIKNDWSKTVQIPFTQSNNKLFGELFKVDRLIVEGDSKLMGIFFDPYKKVDFRLQWGDAILMQGYAKNIDVVKSANGEGHYNITLNGELGKVFQEMKKITFDRTTEDKKYLIDGSNYVDSIINKDLVYELWNNEPDLENLYLVENTDSKYRIQDYIGFIPNNSYDDEFDYKTFQVEDSNTSMKFAEELDAQARIVADDTEATYQTVVGIAADTVIDNGLLPREIGEYRSYLQIPYIYFNKLFQIFAKKTTEITGYDVVIDESWFNKYNPYWNKMVYILQQLSQKTNGKVYKSVLKNCIFGNFTLTDSANGYYTPSLTNTKPITWSSVINTTDFLKKVREDFIQNKFDNITFSQTIPITLTLKDVYNGSTLATENYITLANGYFININFRLKDKNGNVVFTNMPIYLHNSQTTNYDGIGVEINGIPKKTEGEYEITVSIPFNMLIDRSIVGDDFDIEVAVYSSDVYNRGYDTIFYLINNLSGGDIFRAYPNTITVIPLDSEISITTSNNKRSNSMFTLNDLWNNEFNPFDEILNYCKQYRIGVFCDDINKKLIFKPLSTYFSEYKVLDWTDKLDMSSEYHIQPITFENKYLLFNYEKYETELNKQYNEKFGRNYGEYLLSTEYEFNTEEKKLFKYSKTTIPSTDVCLSWTNIHDNLEIIYTLPAEITAYNKDGDKKNVNVFGAMLFYKGIENFDTTSAMRTVHITDDTDFQLLNQTYFYTLNGQDGRNIETLKYPVLDIVANGNLCTFATPNENYTYLPNSYNNTNGIYKNFWEKYLNERYNKQNKIVTCYLRLTPYDIASFQYNNFVKIENQLYMVNKIYDYSIDENIPTKVDLITIQDLKGYTDSNFKIFSIYFKNGNNYELYDEKNHYVDIYQHSTYTIYITSNSEINWSTDSGLQQNVEVNGEVGSGVIAAGNKTPVILYNDEYGPVEGYLEFSNGRDTQKIFVRVR